MDRNEKNVYELRFNDIVLAQSIELAELVSQGEKYAKKFAKKLFVSQAALSDWYVGFPSDRGQNPEVFFDPYFMLKAEVSAPDAAPSQYRFVEGPFLSQSAAVEAAFKISGKTAKLLE